MKTFLKNLPSLYLIFFLFGAYGQSNLRQGNEIMRKTTINGSSESQSSPGFNTSSHSSKIDEGKEYLGDAGSMYLNDDWVEGKAFLRDQTILDPIKLRYNIYQGQMQFILNNDTMAFAKPDELNCLKFMGMTFIYTDYKSEEGVKRDWFELVSDGPCKLLFRRIVTYHLQGEKSITDEKDNSYIRCCSYYVQNGDKPAKMIRLKNKNIACVFSDKEDQIMNFIKTNKLNVKKKDDLVMVVKYYNSLNI